MKHKLALTAVAVAAALSAAACSSGSSTPAASSATPAAPAATTQAAGQPETAAAAKAAAQQYLGLYSAGQYDQAWTLLASTAQRKIPEGVWTAVHQGCPSASAGLSYDVKNVTLTGSTAVVTVTLAGAASGLASESEALIYSAGRWGLVPNDMSLYSHGSAKADLAAAKAAGYCG